MSPSKQKSNERQGARDRKSSAHQAASGNTSASAYDPSSGTFHTLDPLNPDTGAAHLNGRFKSIDDTDDNASSNGGCADVDSMSNNGSYSGESEDQLHISGKDKNGSGKSGTCGADKRDKIRGKNERKHQRQKERRAQELRDKCTGYLMSRKLEALAQKLVAMGFSQERATMALIVNDGHVEQSVAWLLEGGEGLVQEDWNTSGNPKIDISEELGHILEIEKKYNFSRPDIERAIVSCEGDLDKALECLRARGRSTSPSREEEHKAQSRSLENVKEELPTSSPTMSQSLVGSNVRSNAALQPSHQSRRDVRVTALASEGRLHASSFNPYGSLEGSFKGPAQLRKHSSPLTDPHSSVPCAERRGFVEGPFPPVSVKGAPLVSYFTSAASSDTGLVFGSGAPDPRLIYVPIKDYIQNLPVKEPVYAGQMHSLSRTSFQPTVAPNNCPVSSPAFSSSSGFMEGSSPSSVLHVNGAHGDMGMEGTRAARNSMESFELGPLDSPPGHLNPYVSRQLKSQAAQWNGLGKGSSYEVSSAPLNYAAHSGGPSGTSYGLFTGWGAAGLSQSSVDWSTGPMQNCDYRNIDWSMNASPTSIQGVSSQLNSMILQEKSSHHQWNLEGERRFQTNLRAARLLTESTDGHGIWKVGSSRAGMQDNISTESGNTIAHEWTSPFAGKALFNLPQAVSSPSL